MKAVTPPWHPSPSQPIIMILLFLSLSFRCTNAFSVFQRELVQPPTAVGSARIGRTATTTRLRSSTATEPTDSTYQTIRAAVYQSNAATTAPFSNGTTNVLRTLNQITDALRTASLHGIDLVLFPALFLTDSSGGVEDRCVYGLDREGVELNVIGSVCENLSVACVVGYAERKHANEREGSVEEEDGDRLWYDSIAFFHADGTRAGNYRSVSSSFSSDSWFRTGSAFVEAIPIDLRLPPLSPPPPQPNPVMETTTPAEGQTQRTIRIGAMNSNDAIYVPEHPRHLVRSGAELLLIAGRCDQAMRNGVRYVLNARAVENGVPVLFANYVGNDMDRSSREEREDNNDSGNGARGGGGRTQSLSLFVGSSGITSPSGDDLVRGPETIDGDLPYDRGYLFPCDGGDLYAANVRISVFGDDSEADDEGRDLPSVSVTTIIENAENRWVLAPSLNVLDGDGVGGDLETYATTRNNHGFGKQVVKALERKQRGRRGRTGRRK